MNAAIGPRSLTFVAPDGVKGSIEVLIVPQSPVETDLGDGVAFQEFAGKIVIESSWFSREFRVFAADEIQLIFRMIRLADIYIQKICRDNGYELYAYRAGDIQEPFDTMR